MLRRGKKLISLLLLIFFLVSCIPPEEIEKLGIITARGHDVADDGLIENTLIIFQFDVQSSTITKTVSGKGQTLKGAINNANHESLYPLTPGKIEVELYGREAAQKGILPYLDTVQRDARVSNTMYLAISNTTAKEILTMSEESIAMNIGQYLRGVIDHNSIKHNFPRVTLQDFLRTYFNIGIDNVLPIFELENDNIPKVTNIGLFQADRLVGTLPLQEATFLNLLNNPVRDKLLELSLPGQPFKEYLEKREHRNEEGELLITLNIEKGTSKTKLIDKENLIFETEINLKMRLVEQSLGVLFESAHVTRLLEEEIKKKMIAEFESLLAKTQDFAVDPFGYGITYRIQQKDGKLTREEWREKYPEITVKFKVNPKVINHGVTE